MLVLNPEIITISQAIVDSIITICFKTIGHKNLNIKNTVSAILQQLTSISFYSLGKLNNSVIVDSISPITSRKIESNEKHSNQIPLTSRSISSNTDNSNQIVSLKNNDVYKVCQILLKEYILIIDGKGKLQNTIYTKALGNRNLN